MNKIKRVLLGGALLATMALAMSKPGQAQPATPTSNAAITVPAPVGQQPAAASQVTPEQITTALQAANAASAPWNPYAAMIQAALPVLTMLLGALISHKAHTAANGTGTNNSS